MHANLDRSPEVLAHNRACWRPSSATPPRPADSHYWLESRGELIAYLKRLPKPHRWDAWYAATAPVMSLYRESPRALAAAPAGEVTVSNPPPKFRAWCR